MGKISDSSTFPFKFAEDSLGFLLWQTAMYWQRNINKVFLKYELTYTQFIVLVVAGLLKKQHENIY